MKIKLLDWVKRNSVAELKERIKEVEKENHELIGINMGLKEAAEIVIKGSCPKCKYRLGDKIE